MIHQGKFASSNQYLQMTTVQTGYFLSGCFVVGIHGIQSHFRGFVDSISHFRFIVFVDVDLDFLSPEEDDLVQIQPRQIRFT